MAWTTAAVFCVFLALTRGDVLRYKFPSEEQMVKDGGKHWAVLVAGSSTWDNYRHQADICHAYQVLLKHGFSADRIITFMFDDLAHNEYNPNQGVVINHIKGPNVYEGVKIDYRQEDVTPKNFLAVLRGDASAITGKGSGRVLESGPNDHVFINFADHGADGLIAFPDDVLEARKFMKTIKYMHEKQMYKQMVIYIEACESGSMFEGLLPDDINVYATTAANGEESSYACYYDDALDTYLGDVYSVKWMEDSDVENLKLETLHKQYKLVKQETNTSHVQQYGDKSIAKEDVAEFQGGVNYKQPTPQVLPKVEFDAVPSEDVPMAILYRRLAKSESMEERGRIQGHIDWHHQVRARVDALIRSIVELSSRDATMVDYLLAARYPLTDHDCYEQAVHAFHDKCVRIPQNDYALRRLYLLSNLCESGIPAAKVLESIHKACAGAYRL